MIKGFKVTVTIDRPIGFIDAYQNNYPINYGYIKGILAKDNEWQDAYILTNEQITTPTIEGQVIAIIVRENDLEDKWVVTTNQEKISKKEIREKTLFLERYFHSTIYLLD